MNIYNHLVSVQTMPQTPTITVRGLDTILSYDNIAIVVLMVMLLLETSLVYYLLKNLFKTKEVLASLHTAITVLNERLRHHDDS